MRIKLRRKIMMRFLLLILVLLLPVQAHAMQTGIAVVVNEDAISFNELNDRLRLVMASSRLPDRPEVQAQLTPQILNNLIEEQLKLQEARRLEIEITPEEIENGFATIAGQNNLALPDFRAMLQQSGVNPATMARQIESQIAWSKVVGSSLRSQVTVTDNDIANVLERHAANVGKTEYLVAEIVLAVPSAEEDANVRKLAQDLIAQVRSGQAPFFRLAQQFSSAPGAPQGGNLGWIQEGQLVPNLDRVLRGMEKEQVSDAVRTPAGYHILALRDVRVVSAESAPAEQDIRSSLGMERLERLQQRRLMDLKAAAFIENRLGE